MSFNLVVEQFNQVPPRTRTGGGRRSEFLNALRKTSQGQRVLIPVEVTDRDRNTPNPLMNARKRRQSSIYNANLPFRFTFRVENGELYLYNLGPNQG